MSPSQMDHREGEEDEQAEYRDRPDAGAASPDRAGHGQAGRGGRAEAGTAGAAGGPGSGYQLITESTGGRDDDQTERQDRADRRAAEPDPAGDGPANDGHRVAARNAGTADRAGDFC